MPLLRVDFQGGFDHDDVVVRVDGQTEVRREQVTTRADVGYGGSVEFQVEVGSLELTIEVTTGKLHGRTPVDVAGDVYVGVSVSGGEIGFLVSPEPLGYL